MTNCLFYYRRRVKTDDPNEVVTNDNFINPLNILSMYWQTNAEGKKSLSVFLANGFTVTLPESTGNKLVQHTEDFLRYLIGGRTETAPRQYNERQNNHNRDNTPPRTARKPIEVEDVVDEEPQINQPASWDN